MQISFLIVTKNRSEELAFTLEKLKGFLDLNVHEVLVFIDGCKETEKIISKYDWVNWTISEKTISASPARNVLYKKGKGIFFIGLDDDAHPLTANFIPQVVQLFEQNKAIGIIAFQEIRGVYPSDETALINFKSKDSHLTNEFVGCGFAIKKSVYDQTKGFPNWMTIYGEESALALEVLDLGYEILYENNIAVNHRVDAIKRIGQGRSYFRFEHQLKNSIRFYMVYYPNPFLKVAKLLLHNFRKYAVMDFHFFKLYNKAVFSSLFQIKTILKNRKPVKKATLEKSAQLRRLIY